MSLVLREFEATDLRLDPETNIVTWTWPTVDGRGRREAMHYPLFVRTVFASLAFIEQTNEARERAARAASDRVVSLRKRDDGGDGHAAAS